MNWKWELNLHGSPEKSIVGRETACFYSSVLLHISTHGAHQPISQCCQIGPDFQPNLAMLPSALHSNQMWLLVRFLLRIICFLKPTISGLKRVNPWNYQGVNYLYNKCSICNSKVPLFGYINQAVDERWLISSAPHGSPLVFPREAFVCVIL